MIMDICIYKWLYIYIQPSKSGSGELYSALFVKGSAKKFVKYAQKPGGIEY